MGPFPHFFFLIKEDHILQKDTKGLKKKKLTYFTIEIKKKKLYKLLVSETQGKETQGKESRSREKILWYVP